MELHPLNSYCGVFKVAYFGAAIISLVVISDLFEKWIFYDKLDLQRPPFVGELLSNAVQNY